MDYSGLASDSRAQLGEYSIGTVLNVKCPCALSLQKGPPGFPLGPPTSLAAELAERDRKVCTTARHTID